MSDDEEAKRYADEFGTEQLFRIARAGIELEAARSTPVFTLIMQSAAVEAARAMEVLIDADAGDVERIRELQHTIRRHRDMEKWVLSAIDRGLAASRDLESRASPD